MAGWRLAALGEVDRFGQVRAEGDLHIVVVGFVIDDPELDRSGDTAEDFGGEPSVAVGVEVEVVEGFADGHVGVS